MIQTELPNLPYEKWLNTAQVGAAMGGASAETIRRWIYIGLPNGKEIPQKFIDRRGFAGEWLLHPAVIDYLRAERLNSFCS
jgi:hypothetical protein